MCVCVFGQSKHLQAFGYFVNVFGFVMKGNTGQGKDVGGEQSICHIHTPTTISLSPYRSLFGLLFPIRSNKGRLFTFEDITKALCNISIYMAVCAMPVSLKLIAIDRLNIY